MHVGLKLIYCTERCLHYNAAPNKDTIVFEVGIHFVKNVWLCIYMFIYIDIDMYINVYTCVHICMSIYI